VNDPPLDGSSPDDDLMRRAATLARRAHAGQRRDDGAPFVTHPHAVARILRDEIGVRDERMLAAALLHDVLEDTPVRRAELDRVVGPVVSGWVHGLTKQVRDGEPRDDRIGRDLRRVRDAGPEAVVVKIADRMHNLRTIHGCRDARKRRRFLDETRRLYLPFFEDHRPDLAGLVRRELDRASRADAGT